MKYNELEKRIKKNGCYDTGEQQAGHPLGTALKQICTSK